MNSSEKASCYTLSLRDKQTMGRRPDLSSCEASLGLLTMGPPNLRTGGPGEEPRACSGVVVLAGQRLWGLASISYFRDERPVGPEGKGT